MPPRRRFRVADIADVGIDESTASVGDSYDEAPAETVSGLYKSEVIHSQTGHQVRVTDDSNSSKTVEWAGILRDDCFGEGIAILRG